MRVAYIINSVEGGGAQSPVPAVARVLQAHGCELQVFALTPRDRRGLPSLQAAGLTTHVREGGERDHAQAFLWLAGKLADWRPNLLWTSLTRATVIGQLIGAGLRVPVASWQHNAFLKPGNEALLRATRRLSTVWIADSQCVAAKSVARLNIRPERLMTWPLFEADAGAPQARPWRPGEPIRIGALGRLHRNKGYETLIAAVARMRREGFEPPPFELEIAGEGAARPALEAAIAAAGLSQVRLVGFAERPQAFLAGLHLYLQPSRAEGLCIAAHEAMQAGLPTIVSAVGELPYSVVDGLTGLVVPPDDPEALSDALVTLLRRPEELATMGAAARARVLEQFSPDAFGSAGAAVMAKVGGFVGRRSRGARATGPEAAASVSLVP